MSKTIFSYSVQTREYLHMHTVDDDYQPREGETFVELPEGIGLPAYFAGDHWEGTPMSEVDKRGAEQAAKYLAKHPELTAPSAGTQSLNMLGQQLIQAQMQSKTNDAELTDKVDKLTESVNLLGQMLAQQAVKPVAPTSQADSQSTSASMSGSASATTSAASSASEAGSASEPDSSPASASDEPVSASTDEPASASMSTEEVKDNG